MKIAILVPHMFMDESIMSKVIFSPGTIAIDLAEGLADLGHEVTLFSPGPIKNKKFKNICSDRTLIEKELDSRGYDLTTLMSKHPLTYITLARQIQSELISKAYKMANNGLFDLVHVWINEEDIALEFAKLCNKPIIFTHHEPFNFYTKYRTSFEKYKDLNWVSISYAQRKTIPVKMNWVGNVYHGIRNPFVQYKIETSMDYKKYFAYLGRIIESKGVHLAVQAVIKYNEKSTNEPIILKIAGKYYEDSYWEKEIKPYVDNKFIQFVEFISKPEEKFNFLYNAKALLAPSTWEEPFGMMIIEAMSVGTLTIGLSNGALKEIVKDGVNGFISKDNIEQNFDKVNQINSKKLIDSFDFTIERMCEEYEKIYQAILT
ncbi:MAG: glycosyltransferase [Candidatus Dojkabacteria bacterium]